MINVAADPSGAVELALNLFGNDILRLSYSYLKKREDAEDIVQDTLIRLMQSDNSFDTEALLKSWLLRVAANLCKDHLKSAAYRKQTSLPEGYDVAAEDQPEADEGGEVLSALMSLPEKYRSVLHLYYYEEYATKEIAVILDKKETTVRSLLKRGREKMAERLKQRGSGPGAGNFTHKNMEKGDSGYEGRI